MTVRSSIIKHFLLECNPDDYRSYNQTRELGTGKWERDGVREKGRQNKSYKGVLIPSDFTPSVLLPIQLNTALLSLFLL